MSDTTAPTGIGDFGVRLAERARPRLRATDRIGHAGSIGVVGRSTLGFARIVASAGSARPAVGVGNLASLSLRPPRAAWSMHPPEDDIVEPARTWTSSALPATVRRTPAPAPAQPTRRTTRRQPQGDRKVDALRRLLERTGKIAPSSTDTAEPTEINAPTPMPAAGSPETDRSTQPAAPGDRSATSAGPTTAPGQLARRSRPEVVSANDRLTDALPERAPAPGRSAGRSRPRPADKPSGMDGFRRALAAHGLIEGGEEPPTRPRASAASANAPSVRREPAEHRSEAARPRDTPRSTPQRTRFPVADDGDPERGGLADRPGRRLPLSVRGDAPDRLGAATTPVATSAAATPAVSPALAGAMAVRSVTGSESPMLDRLGTSTVERPDSRWAPDPAPPVLRSADPDQVPMAPASRALDTSRAPAAHVTPVAMPTPPGTPSAPRHQPAAPAPRPDQPPHQSTDHTVLRDTPGADAPGPAPTQSAAPTAAPTVSRARPGLAPRIRRSLTDVAARHGVPHTRSDRRRPWSMLGQAAIGAFDHVSPTARAEILRQALDSVSPVGPVTSAGDAPPAATTPSAPASELPVARSTPPQPGITAPATPTPASVGVPTEAPTSAPTADDVEKRSDDARPAAERPGAIARGLQPDLADPNTVLDQIAPPASPPPPSQGTTAPAHNTPSGDAAPSRRIDRAPEPAAPGRTQPARAEVDRPGAATRSITRGHDGASAGLPRPGQVVANRVLRRTEIDEIGPLHRALRSVGFAPSSGPPPLQGDRGAPAAPSAPARVADASASGAPALVRRTPADTDESLARPAPPVTIDGGHTASELAQRFLAELGRAPSAASHPMPTPFEPLARAIAPATERVRVSSDATSRRALRSVGKKAATVGDVIHLAEAPRPGRATAEVIAHELTHVAHPSPVPRFFDDDERGPEERLAERVASVIARAPVSPGAPVPSRRTTDDVVRRSPAPGRANSTPTSSPGSITAEALAESLGAARSGGSGSGSGSSSVRRDTVRRDVIRRDPALDESTTGSSSPPSSSGGSGPDSSSGGGASTEPMTQDQFDVLLQRAFPMLVRRIEDQIMSDLLRRGGRHWRTPW